MQSIETLEDRLIGRRDFTDQIHGEKSIDGFTKHDGTIKFYSFVRAIMLRYAVATVLDYGAGRGAFWHESDSAYKKHLQDLRFGEAEVTACDIDREVLGHPCSHKQVLLQKDQPLPFADRSFDLILSDFTFEHLDDPESVCAELLRVLRPGGFICARTANSRGYVKFFAQLTPNRWHAGLLERIQPERKGADVFPTTYKLNNLRDVRRHFPRCTVFHYFDGAEPSYYFGSVFIYRSLLLLHKILPDSLATGVCFFIQKPKA